jgi:hypothetical protein
MLRRKNRQEKKNRLKSVLADELDKFKELSYQELRNKVGRPETLQSGKTGDEDFYQLEIEFFFDDPREKKDIRVLGLIDDGGLRSFSPISDSFIMTPDGKLL